MLSLFVLNDVKTHKLLINLAEYENLEPAIEATEHYIYQNYDMDYVRSKTVTNDGEYLKSLYLKNLKR